MRVPKTLGGGGARMHLRSLVPQPDFPWSTKAVHRLGEQPLHTYDAHLLSPPDVVVFYSALPNPRSIRLTALARTDPSAQAAFAQGLFTVRAPEGSFLSSVCTGDAGWVRYDAAVMSPGDARARQAAHEVARRRAGAEVHMWEHPDQLLFVDNRRFLHGFEALQPGEAAPKILPLTYRLGVS